MLYNAPDSQVEWLTFRALVPALICLAYQSMVTERNNTGED